MNNGYGTGIVFTMVGTSQPFVSGSILSFDLDKAADMKEITDGSNNTFYVGISKRIKTAQSEVLFTGSGSAFNLPNMGDIGTLTVPWSADVTGSWGITKASLSGKSDDAVKVKFEVKQWTKSDGTTLP